MDNKVTKKRINDHLEYDWYKYLILLIVGIVVIYFTFSQINRTRDYEDVAFFVSCYDSSDNGFETRVKREMQQPDYRADKYGENVLLEISFEAQDPLGDNYGTMLQTHGMISSDVLVLGKSLMENAAAGFVELTDELLTEYLLPAGTEIDDYEYYEAEFGGEKQRMGIKVSDFTRPPFTFDWYKIEKYKDKYGNAEENNRPDTEFYLVLNRSSVNIGKFGKEADDRNAQALYLVNRFIGYYNREA